MVWAAAAKKYVSAKNVGGATYTGVIWIASQTNLKSIPDGTSKVYLIGEKYLDQIDYTNSYSGSADEESLYSGFDDDFIRLGSGGGIRGHAATSAPPSPYSPFIYPPQQDSRYGPRTSHRSPAVRNHRRV